MEVVDWECCGGVFLFDQCGDLFVVVVVVDDQFQGWIGLFEYVVEGVFEVFQFVGWYDDVDESLFIYIY